MRNRSLSLFLVITGITVAALATAQEKKGVVWLGSGLTYEFRPDQDKPFTLALGAAAFVKRTTRTSGFGSSTEEKLVIGPVAEGLFYANRSNSGFAYGARVGTADGATYIAPSLMFTGQGRSVIGRIGVFFPMGRNISPFAIELGIGFRV